MFIRYCIIILVVLLDQSVVFSLLEPWNFMVRKANNEEECENYCNIEPICRTWIYQIHNSECRLNKYVESVRNIHAAREKNIDYISGLKSGKKRLRQHMAQSARRLNDKETDMGDDLNYDRSRTGPYLWEKDNWEGSVINTCNLMKELTGSKSQIPVMDKVIENCPLDKCLSYGTREDNGKKTPILGKQVIEEFQQVFDKNVNKISNIKSHCYRIMGRKKTSCYDGENKILCMKRLRNVEDNEDESKYKCSNKQFCCEGDHQIQNMDPMDQSELNIQCVGCMPTFFSVGPQKTGSTDLYSRLTLLKGVVPAYRKETGWWSEGILQGPFHKTLAGYMLKFFPRMSLLIDTYDRGLDWEEKINILKISKKKDMQGKGRRKLLSYLNETKLTPAEMITGEATPAMFNFQHHGLSLIPRWLRCIYPQAKIIVTMRNPIDRTYSDFKFYGKLQATKGYLSKFKEKREEYIHNLTPSTFDAAMKEEVVALRQCFSKDSYDRLIWVNNQIKPTSCDVLRTEQLEKLGFQGKRIPGRLLMSLYPMHMALWLRYFPCNQILLLRSEGAWSEQTMHEIALFLDVDPGSAKKAAAAEAVRPEQFQFSKEANSLAVGVGFKGDQGMWNSTRSLLAEFFEDHWLARFSEEEHQVESCMN